MSRLPFTIFDIRALVRETLSETLESHAARIEPDPSRRDALQTICSHRNWNATRHWCNDCGIAQEQIYFRRHVSN